MQALQHGFCQMSNKKTIAYLVLNNLGGITNLIQNLILYKNENSLPDELYLLDVEGNINAPASPILDTEIGYKKVYFNPKSNWYHSFHRISKELSKNTGVLISNDQYDLIMLQAFNIPRKVIQLVHDSYNLQLSIKYHEMIDGFIAHNRDIFDQLQKQLPERKIDIWFQTYGIPIDTNLIYDKKINESLRLIYIGRHDINKGIHDLYPIHLKLKEKQIGVQWIILGEGPETKRLKEQWQFEENVQFHLAINAQHVLEFAYSSDILVFPTKFEGSPLAVLEAMSVGCVPVVTDLPGGISETISDGQNGIKCQLNQLDEFVIAIEHLHNDRNRLKLMQENCRETIKNSFNVYKKTEGYLNIFDSYINLNTKPRHHHVNKKIGSRFDHQFIPDVVTKFIRSIKL